MVFLLRCSALDSYVLYQGKGSTKRKWLQMLNSTNLVLNFPVKGYLLDPAIGSIWEALVPTERAVEVNGQVMQVLQS